MQASCTILPTNQYASFPLQPGKEAFNQPAAVVPPQVTPILVLSLRVERCGALRLPPSYLRSSSSPSLSYVRSPMRCSGLASSMENWN